MHVWCESDCAQVINFLSIIITPRTNLGKVIDDIKLMGSTFGSMVPC